MTTLLDLDEVAAELAVKPIEVQRLIARGRLVASRPENGGPYRMARETLSAYVQNGAIDLRKLHLSDKNWFDLHSSVQFVAKQFEEKAAAALGAHQLTVDEVKAKFEALGPASPAEIKIESPVPPEVRTLMAQPIVKTAFYTQAQFDALLVRNAGEAFLVDQLHIATQRAINTAYPGRIIAGINQFFDSTETYALGVAAGMAAMKNRRIMFKEIYKWEEPDPRSFVRDAPPITHCKGILYSFRLAAIVDAAMERRLAEIAF